LFAAPWFSSYGIAADSGSDSIEVDLMVDPTTVNGNPWGGGGAFILHSIPFMPNNPTVAPSVIFCVVTLEHPEPDCHGIRENGKLHSSCVQSFDCEWTNLHIPDDVFAFVFFSRGMMFTKLVDIVIFTRHRLTANNPDRHRIEDVARQAAARLAPPLLHSEVERRERPFQIFGLDDCASGCRLRQSKITLLTGD
jgi:hypothetical protein